MVQFFEYININYIDDQRWMYISKYVFATIKCNLGILYQAKIAQIFKLDHLCITLFDFTLLFINYLKRKTIYLHF